MKEKEGKREFTCFGNINVSHANKALEFHSNDKERKDRGKESQKENENETKDGGARDRK
jgi:hypothetical protein